MNQQQPEDLIFFDSKGLDLLIKQMGFDEVISFDEKPRQMIIDIGNEFMSKMLEESLRISHKRQTGEEEKKQQKRLAIQDVKFALCIDINIQRTLPESATIKLLHRKGKLKYDNNSLNFILYIYILTMNELEEYDDQQFEESQCIDDNDHNEFLQNEQNQQMTDNLQQCQICNRKFNCERIEKHKEVCEKAKRNQIEREKFITKKLQQKAEQQQKAKVQDKQVKNKTVNNWREQHQQFQEMIQYNKKVQEVSTQGGDLRSIKTPEIVVNSHYVYCEHCQRSFAPNVAEKHIPKCKEVRAKPKPPKRVQKREQQSELKRTAQLSTASTNNGTRLTENMDSSKHTFRPLGLMKTAEMQKRQLPVLKNAIYTGFGFMDCQTRATALSDTECPFCLRKFNPKAAQRHIPICENLTNKESFKQKMKNRVSVPISKKTESILPAIVAQQPQMKKILKETDIQLASQGPKFCTQCGNKMQSIHKYCGGCGHKRESD